tara:strand:- start:260 stop:1078 length:819 start_codon:yes stop_codon:yes gene_type:complete
MSIITLTSDYGTKDFFSSAIKGTILSEINHAIIVDISHEINPFHLTECAYIIQNSYKHFPKNSIHIISIDTEIQKNKQHIAVYINDHYFITSDSGLMSLVFPHIKPIEIVSINITGSHNTELFPAKDVFAKIACHILRGGKLSVIGTKIDTLKCFKARIPVELNNGKSLAGEVIYIDRFGNIITNINKDLFYKTKGERNFIIHLPRGKEISTIHLTYSDVTDGTVVVLFNSSGLLEVAINRADKNAKSGASTLLGIKEGDQIIVNFLKDKDN